MDLGALRADTVGKFRLRMLHDVSLEPGPMFLLVEDVFAVRADWAEPLELLHPPRELRTLPRDPRDEDGDGKMDKYCLTRNYREPFFFIPFLTGFGGWVMDENGNPTPDNEHTVRAIQFVLDLRAKDKIIPQEGDYEIADMLFKERRAAMIINGPWSWAGYDMPTKSMVATLPFNTETGLWCEPISAKGYSVSASPRRRKSRWSATLSPTSSVPKCRKKLPFSSRPRRSIGPSSPPPRSGQPRGGGLDGADRARPSDADPSADAANLRRDARPVSAGH